MSAVQIRTKVQIQNRQTETNKGRTWDTYDLKYFWKGDDKGIQKWYAAGKVLRNIDTKINTNTRKTDLPMMWYVLERRWQQESDYDECVGYGEYSGIAKYAEIAKCAAIAEYAEISQHAEYATINSRTCQGRLVLLQLKVQIYHNHMSKST